MYPTPWSPASLCLDAQRAQCLPSPWAFLQHETPSHRKNVPSATFTSPSALWGQRPRGAHGPSAAFQDGQPPALASPAAGQLPGARVKKAETPLPKSLHGAGLGAVCPGPRAPPGGLKAHSVLWPLGKFPELFSALGTLPCAFGGVDFPICPALLGAGSEESC